jgi:hypothetical protein
MSGMYQLYRLRQGFRDILVDQAANDTISEFIVDVQIEVA